eukprot:XP_001706244.1 Hypothetical protein GL50803_117849 [Giardia lamblia ATCC 50803]
MLFENSLTHHFKCWMANQNDKWVLKREDNHRLTRLYTRKK